MNGYPDFFVELAPLAPEEQECSAPDEYQAALEARDQVSGALSSGNGKNYPSSGAENQEMPEITLLYKGKSYRLDSAQVAKIAGSNSDSDLEIKINEALDDLERLLLKKKLNSSEMKIMRRHLKLFASERAALDFLGTERVRRYFKLLSGPGLHLPYTFVLPVEERHLEIYLTFDRAHDDPDYLDQCVFDTVFDLSDKPPSGAELNLLISRLKGNPDLCIEILRQSLQREKELCPHLKDFLGPVRENSEFRNAYFLLMGHFFRKKRIDDILKYFDASSGGQALKAGKIKERIQNEEKRFLGSLKDSVFY